jgi:hypothetical protein
MGAVHPAPIQLADLAAVMRPDWDRADLEGAVAASRASGWSWPRVFIEVARLLVLEESSPRDLTAAARNPVQAPMAPADPELARSWAADIRAMLAARRAS